MAARKVLNELIRRDGLDNKVCNDCPNPNPQWASLSFAVFLCLQCAGTHRGFGVHISFVRSVAMDAWQDDQLKRMQLGGNAPFREFMKSYDPSGGYKENASPYEKYHCWAATQYREKLDALLADIPWSPSAPPSNYLTPMSSDPASRSASPNPSGLRKSRAQTTRTTPGRSASPASPPTSSTASSTPADQKSRNDAYFTSLGAINSSRPVDLPPSQGGRYQGFGNTPDPPPTSNPDHPSFSLSSANAPTFADIQENPVAALSKGWSLFSAAVVGASRVVNDNVIQPGLEKINDPEFQSNVRGYVNDAGRRAAEVGGAANQWGKQSIGIDVADTMYGVKERVLGGPQRYGYGHVDIGEEERSALYDPNGRDTEDDWFGEFHSGRQGEEPGSTAAAASAGGWAGGEPTSLTAKPAAMRKPTGSVTSRAKVAKKDDDWDEWKDF